MLTESLFSFREAIREQVRSTSCPLGTLHGFSKTNTNDIVNWWTTAKRAFRHLSDFKVQDVKIETNAAASEEPGLFQILSRTDSFRESVNDVVLQRFAFCDSGRDERPLLFLEAGMQFRVLCQVQFRHLRRLVYEYGHQLLPDHYACSASTSHCWTTMHHLQSLAEAFFLTTLEDLEFGLPLTCPKLQDRPRCESCASTAVFSRQMYTFFCALGTRALGLKRLKISSLDFSHGGYEPLFVAPAGARAWFPSLEALSIEDPSLWQTIPPGIVYHADFSQTSLRELAMGQRQSIPETVVYAVASSRWGQQLTSTRWCCGIRESPISSGHFDIPKWMSCKSLRDSFAVLRHKIENLDLFYIADSNDRIAELFALPWPSLRKLSLVSRPGHVFSIDALCPAIQAPELRKLRASFRVDLDDPSYAELTTAERNGCIALSLGKAMLHLSNTTKLQHVCLHVENSLGDRLISELGKCTFPYLRTVHFVSVVSSTGIQNLSNAPLSSQIEKLVLENHAVCLDGFRNLLLSGNFVNLQELVMLSPVTWFSAHQLHSAMNAHGSFVRSMKRLSVLRLDLDDCFCLQKPEIHAVISEIVAMIHGSDSECRHGPALTNAIAHPIMHTLRLREHTFVHNGFEPAETDPW
eukprot:ANDGO_04852.mRNA.1 hypothetical protein